MDRSTGSIRWFHPGFRFDAAPSATAKDASFKNYLNPLLNSIPSSAMRSLLYGILFIVFALYAAGTS